MRLFTRRKALPIPSGMYVPAYVDLMTEYSQYGVFVRLYYPTTFTKGSENMFQKWLPWVPHDKYVEGLAFVVGLWVLVIRLVMWWYGGLMYIPAMFEASLLPKHQRQDRKLPVIIFSHGFGATRFLCSSMLTELASQGYVVASIEHRDTSACATYFYQSPSHRDRDERTWIEHTRLQQLGGEHFKLRKKQIKYRRDECIKALELLEDINKGNPSSNILNTNLNLQDFEGQLDLERVTIMGHSFGGATALLSLSSDSRFKQGVILDGWMFPVKDEDVQVVQPLLFINSPTFHIASNLAVMDRFISRPSGAHRQLCIIKTSTHETPTDTPFVLGYWLDNFKKKIDPTLGNTINNYLILKFLHNYTGVPPSGVEDIEKVLRQHEQYIIEGATPSPVPPRKRFSLTNIFS